MAELHNNFGKAELLGNSAYAPNGLSKSPAVSKPTPTMSVVTPVSPMERREEVPCN
jgi:hypothetical protein